MIRIAITGAAFDAVAELPFGKAQRRSGKEFIFPSGAPRSPKRTDPDIRIVAELSGTWSRPWRRELIGDLETGRWRRTAAIKPEAARRRKAASGPWETSGLRLQARGP
jgi:hypothetical protein